MLKDLTCNLYIGDATSNNLPVMTINHERKVTVNDLIPVNETAKRVLEVLSTLTIPGYPPFNDDDIKTLRDFHATIGRAFPMGMKDDVYALGINKATLEAVSKILGRLIEGR